MSDRHFDYDCVFVGGGLVNSLYAYWLKQKSPHLKIVIIEKGQSLGGNHTWSFHEKDLTKTEMKLILPFLSKKWEGYDVFFPKYRRTLPSAYLTVRSDELHVKVSSEIPVEFNTEVVGVAPHNVTGKSGKQWSSRCVIDGRGFDLVNPEMVGYQKFVGLELEFEVPHGLHRPILMDATCPQKNSFRFFYCLPWDEKKLLVEDTRYAEKADLDLEEYREEIKQYCSLKGWKISKVLREEVGALPIPLRAKYLPMNKGFPEAWVQRLVPCVGVRGGLFHSTTGYSLPYAVRMVSHLIELEPKHEVVFPKTVQLARRYGRSQWFFRLLNRMLFIGSEPNVRYRILEFFYRMPKGLINRFYAGKLWPTDYLRIFLGAPPIRVSDALKCLLHNRERNHA